MVSILFRVLKEGAEGAFCFNRSVVGLAVSLLYPIKVQGPLVRYVLADERVILYTTCI